MSSDDIEDIRAAPGWFEAIEAVTTSEPAGRGVAADIPTDVRTVLTQLFTEGRAAARDGDLDTASATTETARRVATNKLPDGAVRDRLLHGCGRVAALLDDGDSEVAAEYLRGMARRVEK